MERTSRYICLHRKRIICAIVLVLFLVTLRIILVPYYQEPLTISNVYSECSLTVSSNCLLENKLTKSSTLGDSNSPHSYRNFSSEQETPSALSQLSGSSLENLRLQTAQTAERPPLLSVSRIVHQIVWENSLTFRNFLSILSVIKYLKPYILILHTKKSFKLRPSEFDYNDWGEKVVARIPNVQIQTLNLLEKKEYSHENEIDCARSVLMKAGGIYLNINTLVAKSLWDDENQRLQTTTNITKHLSYLIMSRTNELSAKSSWEGLSGCAPAENFTSSETCCIISKDIVPANIMSAVSAFGFLARTLFYGTPDIPKLDISFPAIPKIVHYVWFGNKDINYSMFLSFLSTQRFVRPTKIYIYVDQKTRSSSVNFDKMVSYSNVEVVFYGPLESIHQKHIVNPSHASDIVRADVLLRYGGIYIDWDVYWMKPVDDLVSKGYETIAALDFYKDMYPRQGFPDTINMGVLMERPGSKFLSLWRDSFRDYKGNRHPTYHAVEIVYKIYEENPDLLYIDSRLQIMCFKFKCHPLWLDNYKNANANNKFDFKKDVYSVHFTNPTPDSFKSEAAVRTSKGFYGDMARHISGI